MKLQVIRIIFAIGAKALLDGMPASAIASVPSKRSRPGSAPGCGTAQRSRPRPRYGENDGNTQDPTA